MPPPTEYSAKPFIFTSRGLDARHELDRVPEEYYLLLTNCFEREEGSMSSRYGLQLINRDPLGTPPPANNNAFATPVTSLARLLNQTTSPATSYRYAGTQGGLLYRRQGTSQGPFTQIYSGLSGQPFQSLVAPCFETSQPYLFIYDQNVSLKDTGVGTAPQLTGIDPPPYTPNTQPFAPLLTLIDNFAAANSYATAGFSAPWTFVGVTTILVASSSATSITDFTQFNAVSSSDTIPGGTTSDTQTNAGTSSQFTVYGGFPSAPVSGTVSISVPISGSYATGGAFRPSFPWGSTILSLAYSIDSGSSWTQFYTQSLTAVGISGGSFTSTTVTAAVVGLNNLNTLRIRVTVTCTVNSGIAGSRSISSSATAGTMSALFAAAGIFGAITDGMLSNLGTTPSINIPIVDASTLGGFPPFLTPGPPYNTLAIAVPTGYTLPATGANIAVYGTSNPLADGFYTVIGTHGSTIIYAELVGESPTAFNTSGGFVRGASTAGSNPASCILGDLYAYPYPAQFSAWGFYQAVQPTTTSFPVGSWAGTVATNTTAIVAKTVSLDLSLANAINDFDLIVLTLKVGSPANISSIKLQFDVNNSGYTSSYYTATISPAYYQGSITNQVSAYQATQNQIIADSLSLLTGQPLGSTTAQLQPSNFSTGSGAWVAVLIPRGNFLPVGNAGQSGLDWGNITGWQIVVQTTATAVTGDGSSTVACNGLYLQWGYGPDSFGGTGYDWRYTYYNANTGTESSPSPEQQFNKQFGYLSSLAAPFYLRQAAQVTGPFSTDTQVTHVRVYRRGGTLTANWLLIDQFTNLPTSTQFFAYKDVIGDAVLLQAPPLALDNDPPVTSTLVQPILTTLAAATLGPGSSYYSIFQPQLVSVNPPTGGGAYSFVTDQTVLVGNSPNLEEVLVIAGGTNQFTAILRLQHNPGEQVSATSVPRQPPSICCLAYGRAFVVDPLNPANVAFSKEGYPENFSPADYIVVGAADNPVMALIDWRGTLVAACLKTWKIIVGGAKPYAQPTGAAHGLVATAGWTIAEGQIIFRAADGWRAFSGADGEYMTLPVEQVFRASPLILLPKADPASASLDVFAYYQNQIYGSYVSTNVGGTRFRLRFDTVYKRFGLDDVQATAMLWEQDTNTLLVGKPIDNTGTSFGVFADWQGDYDDGGWNVGGTALIQTPINITTQTPYRDLGKPHHPKQWNMLEGDYNTQGQTLNTTLFFNKEPQGFIVLDTVNTASQRKKVQFKIPPDSATNTATGVQAYSMSIQHQMAVTIAPTFYQENIYAVLLADYRTSWDSYWQKFEGDYLGIPPKNLYVDYTAGAQLIVQLFLDGQSSPYYIDQQTLILQANRAVVRVQLPARKCRLWRVVMLSAQPFQLWAPVRTDVKPLLEGSGYEQKGFEVYE